MANLLANLSEANQLNQFEEPEVVSLELFNLFFDKYSGRAPLAGKVLLPRFGSNDIVDFLVDIDGIESILVYLDFLSLLLLLILHFD